LKQLVICSTQNHRLGNFRQNVLKVPHFIQERIGGMLIFRSQAIEPVGGYTTCDAWPVRRNTYGYLPKQRPPLLPATAPWLTLILIPLRGGGWVQNWPEGLVTRQDGVPAKGHPSQY